MEDSIDPNDLIFLNHLISVKKEFWGFIHKNGSRAEKKEVGSTNGGQ